MNEDEPGRKIRPRHLQRAMKNVTDSIDFITMTREMTDHTLTSSKKGHTV